MAAPYPNAVPGAGGAGGRGGGVGDLPMVEIPLDEAQFVQDHGKMLEVYWNPGVHIGAGMQIPNQYPAGVIPAGGAGGGNAMMMPPGGAGGMFPMPANAGGGMGGMYPGQMQGQELGGAAGMGMEQMPGMPMGMGMPPRGGGGHQYQYGVPQQQQMPYGGQYNGAQCPQQ